MNNTKILLGLTTTEGSNWQDKVKEIDTFGLKETGLLPTTFNYEQRQELYKKLEQTSLQEIPFVHLRYDMEQEELDYLVENYKTKIFCAHANEKSFEMINNLPKYLSMIYIENANNEKFLKYFNVKKFEEHNITGICLDLAHLEGQRRLNKIGYNRVKKMLNKYPVGCNHVSAIKTNIFLKLFHKKVASHDLKDLKDNLHKELEDNGSFSKYIVLELENSFQEQIEIKKHLENMLDCLIN